MVSEFWSVNATLHNQINMENISIGVVKMEKEKMTEKEIKDNQYKLNKAMTSAFS